MDPLHLNTWTQYAIYCTYDEFASDFMYLFDLLKFCLALVPIHDFRYHIKYMFVGDMLKDATEAIIRRLRPELQMRLRFISHLSVDEISASSGQKSV